MYSKHCHIVLEDGVTEIMSLKLHHLPVPDMLIKMEPISTGVQVTYKVEHVILEMKELTNIYPGPPVASDVNWGHKWVIIVSVV